MGGLNFQLDFLDGIVGALRSMAGEHEDMSRSLQGHAGSAQSIGADGWVVDQVRYAASLLGGHPDLFRQLSSELESRLELAHKAADVWSGGQTALRAELTLAMTASAGLLKAASTSTKANPRVQVAAKKTASIVTQTAAKGLSSLPSALLFSPFEPKDDCFAYVSSVMSKMGITYVPVVSSSASWLDHTDPKTKKLIKTGFTQVAGDPPAMSFFQMGIDTTGAQHSGIYLGSAGGYAYIAHANWGIDAKGNPLQNPQGIYKVDSNGHLTPVYAPQADGSVIGSPDQVPADLKGGPPTGAADELAKLAANAGFHSIGLFKYVGQSAGK